MTGYFDVDKGKEDIQIVYDASKCGLNAAVWSPNFGLPTVDLVRWTIDPGSWMGDIDVGEMFLNFPLDVNIRPYVGVEIKDEDEDENPIRKRGCWCRTCMGDEVYDPMKPWVCKWDDLAKRIANDF
eukprot:3591614-Ditylum_brightwellii.AAC.1